MIIIGIQTYGIFPDTVCGSFSVEDPVPAMDGSAYGEAGNKALFAQMREEDLVAVFGANDDLRAFRSVIDDEVGATVHVDPKGLASTFDQVSDTDDEDQVAASSRGIIPPQTWHETDRGRLVAR